MAVFALADDTLERRLKGILQRQTAAQFPLTDTANSMAVFALADDTLG